MKKLMILSTVVLTALSACTTTDEMIAGQLDRCAKIGYRPGTVAHAQCAERGTMQQQHAQNAATGAVVSTVLTAALLDAFL